MDDFDERAEELSTLQAIYPELELDELDPYSARLELAISPTKPLLVRFVPSGSEADRAGTYVEAAKSGAAYIEHDVELSHLPPLTLHVALPFDYPVEKPPQTRLVTQQDWLPKMKVRELERQVEVLWEEYGHCQILFAYIDYIQQAAEQSFNLDRSAEGCLVLPSSAQNGLVAFDSATKEGVFSASTFDCGICLEPKKGSSCYRMEKCGHVFCRQCLQDFYNNAITEGDVTGVKCLDPTCGKEATSTRKRKRKGERTLHPRELLLMGIDEAMVRRYVEMKRKKRLEADKETVWCPRTWCQGPAKTKKYPPIPSDLSAYIDGEPSDSDDSGVEEPSQTADEPLKNPKNVPPDPTDRLAVCEKCSLAFCKVCFMGWHGPFARCYPRNPAELSAEEKASYDYIRLHTSPCPYCSSPTQKTMGCNHMKCFQCSSHFCYLCGKPPIAETPRRDFSSTTLTLLVRPQAPGSTPKTPTNTSTKPAPPATNASGNSKKATKGSTPVTAADSPAAAAGNKSPSKLRGKPKHKKLRRQHKRKKTNALFSPSPTRRSLTRTKWKSLSLWPKSTLSTTRKLLRPALRSREEGPHRDVPATLFLLVPHPQTALRTLSATTSATTALLLVGGAAHRGRLIGWSMRLLKLRRWRRDSGRNFRGFWRWRGGMRRMGGIVMSWETMMRGLLFGSIA